MHTERGCSPVVRDAWLWCRKVPEVHEIIPGFPHLTVCQPSSEWVPFSNQGRKRQQKLCSRYSGFVTPTVPTAIRLWESRSLLNTKPINTPLFNFGNLFYTWKTPCFKDFYS